MKKKPERLIGLKCASWAAFLTGVAVFTAAAFPQEQAKSVQSADVEVQEESVQAEVTTAAVTAAVSSQKHDALTTSGTVSTEPTGTEPSENAAVTDEPASTDESSEQAEHEESAEQNEPNEPAESPVSQSETPEQPAPAKTYQDGTFTASAYGYDGDITVHVTIQDDIITDITAETAESDDSYFADAKSAVIPAIIRSQAADVDACSGATYSSNGIMAAVRAALESARI